MGNEPILDLESIDRTAVAVSRDELYEYLQQRGTFALLDRLCHVDAEAGTAVGVKEIREDDWWAKDHIPGRPMFPGALMIESAAQIGSFDFSKHRVNESHGEHFVGFGGVEKTRFRGVVTPPSTLFFAVKLEKSGSRMFRYAAEAYVEKDGVLEPKRVFETTVLGVIF